MSVKRKAKLNYLGSKGWLVFWTLVFFPVAMVLLSANSRFELDQKSFAIEYDGSLVWLCFWIIVFFPIAIVLLLVNGFSFTIEEISSGQGTWTA